MLLLVEEGFRLEEAANFPTYLKILQTSYFTGSLPACWLGNIIVLKMSEMC